LKKGHSQSSEYQKKCVVLEKQLQDATLKLSTQDVKVLKLMFQSVFFLNSYIFFLILSNILIGAILEITKKVFTKTYQCKTYTFEGLKNFPHFYVKCLM